MAKVALVMFNTKEKNSGFNSFSYLNPYVLIFTFARCEKKAKIF
jgi:hypothetical protein